MKNTPTLLSPRDVGRRLNLTTSRVIQLDREGVLRRFRDSANRRLYDAGVVERFAQEREAHRRDVERLVRERVDKSAVAPSPEAA